MIVTCPTEMSRLRRTSITTAARVRRKGCEGVLHFFVLRSISFLLVLSPSLFLSQVNELSGIVL